MKADLEAARAAVTDLHSEKNKLSAEIKAQKDMLAQLETQQKSVKQAAAARVAPKKAAPSAPVKAAPKKTVKATPKAAPVKTVNSQKIQWVLRAAQPGQASIAARGSNELKTVRVGDSVDSLGRVQSITIENGRWVVRGTNGLVSQ